MVIHANWDGKGDFRCFAIHLRVHCEGELQVVTVVFESALQNFDFSMEGIPIHSTFEIEKFLSHLGGRGVDDDLGVGTNSLQFRIGFLRRLCCCSCSAGLKDYKK